jgi:hypothetical protein
MLDDQAFNKLVDEIIAQGVDDITATHYAALIGDTPIVDEQGKVVVMKGEREITRLRLNFFQQ